MFRIAQLRPPQTAALCLLAALLLTCGRTTNQVRAADPAPAKGRDIPTLLLDLATDDFDKKKAAIDALAHSAAMRLIPLFEAYGQGALYLWDGRVVYGPDSRKDAAGETVVKLYD